MESKKTRLIKGSDAAKAFMKELRSKRKGKTGGGTPAPPASEAPSIAEAKQDEIIIEPPPAPTQTKRRSRKKITVDFL